MILKWNDTPYGFKETEYKGVTITDSDGSYYPKGITIEICGDISPVDNINEAIKIIDNYVGKERKNR